MPVWFSNVDRHRSHCRLKKCMERSLNRAGELDAANSSGSALYCQQFLGSRSSGGTTGEWLELLSVGCMRWL